MLLQIEKNKGCEKGMIRCTSLRRRNETMKRLVNMKQKQCYIFLDVVRIARDMDVFIIDCFNDVSGANRDVNRLWDVQSKGVKSLNPKKIVRW